MQHHRPGTSGPKALEFCLGAMTFGEKGLEVRDRVVLATKFHMQEIDVAEDEMLRGVDGPVRQGKVLHLACSNGTACRWMETLAGDFGCGMHVRGQPEPAGARFAALQRRASLARFGDDPCESRRQVLRRR